MTCDHYIMRTVLPGCSYWCYSYCQYISSIYAATSSFTGKGWRPSTPGKNPEGYQQLHILIWPQSFKISNMACLHRCFYKNDELRHCVRDVVFAPRGKLQFGPCCYRHGALWTSTGPTVLWVCRTGVPASPVPEKTGRRGGGGSLGGQFEQQTTTEDVEICRMNSTCYMYKSV